MSNINISPRTLRDESTFARPCNSHDGNKDSIGGGLRCSSEREQVLHLLLETL